MLAELMRLRYAIAVAGAHGKTTTTSMIALVLERAGLDPTAVIGGRLSAFGSNARLGRGELMVAEADESDRSFLKLFPTIAVITNIDHEHLESYGGFDDLQQAFVDFANKVPFYGAVVACADDRAPGGGAAAHDAPRDDLRPRSAPDADVTATDVDARAADACSATVKRRARRAGDPTAAPATLGPLTLKVPGRHNLQNALAAVAVGLELGLSVRAHRGGLREFRGAERRFEVRGEPNGILVVDDYGHHPTEIAAVLAAARTLNRRIVVAFQPHRFTRTAALMDAFGPALAGADHVVLTDIYAAGEDPIAGRHARRAGRRRATAASTVPVDVVPRARRCAGRDRADRAAGRRGDHARRRVDRHACRDRADRASLGEEARVSRGRRAADRRFRRAHVEAGATRADWRRLRASLRDDTASLAVVAACTALYRGGAVVAHARAAADRPDRRARQRAAVERRGAGGARAACAARTCAGPISNAWRERLLASPWVRDAALRRSLPSTVEVVVSERRADRHRPHRRRAVSGRRARRDHRRVRAAVRGPRPADHRRPGVAERRAARSTDPARAELAARLIVALGRSRPIARAAVAGRRQRSPQRGGDPERRSGGDLTSATIGSCRGSQSYLELASALRERVPDIDYVDLRFDDRIYVRPAQGDERGGRAEPAAATPGRRTQQDSEEEWREKSGIWSGSTSARRR